MYLMLINSNFSHSDLRNSGTLELKLPVRLEIIQFKPILGTRLYGLLQGTDTESDTGEVSELFFSFKKFIL